MCILVEISGIILSLARYYAFKRGMIANVFAKSLPITVAYHLGCTRASFLLAKFYIFCYSCQDGGDEVFENPKRLNLKLSASLQKPLGDIGDTTLVFICVLKELTECYDQINGTINYIVCSNFKRN